MELPARPRLKSLILAGAAAVGGLVLFYAGGLHFGGYPDMHAYGGRNMLFATTGRELGYQVWAMVCLLPGAAWLAVALTELKPGELSKQLRSSVERWGTARVLVVLSLLVVAVTLWIRFGLLRGTHLTDDESTYLFQTRLLLSGKLAVTPSPDPVFFKGSNSMAFANGRWFPVYPWGHAAVLAVGELFRAPFLIPCALALGTLWLTFLFGKRLGGPFFGLGAAFLLALSPFFEAVSATYLSESSSTFFLLLAWYAGWRWREGWRPAWGLVCGLGLAWAFNCRPLTGAASGLGLALALLPAAWRERRLFLRTAWTAVVPVALGVGAYLLLGRFAEGSTFVPTPLVHGTSAAFGFASVNPKIVAKTPDISLLVMGDYLTRANLWLLGWPCSLLFAFVALAHAPTRRAMGGLFLGVAAVFAGYFFCPFECISDLGPIYIYDTVPLLVLVTCAGIRSAVGFLRAHGDGRWADIPLWGTFALFVITAPQFDRAQILTLDRLAESIDRPIALVNSSDLHHALVFMQNRGHPWTDSWVFYPPLPKPDFSDDVLYVHDRGAAADVSFAARYPDRAHWRLNRNWVGEWKLAVLGTPAATDEALDLRPPPGWSASLGQMPLAPPPEEADE